MEETGNNDRMDSNINRFNPEINCELSIQDLSKGEPQSSDPSKKCTIKKVVSFVDLEPDTKRNVRFVDNSKQKPSRVRSSSSLDPGKLSRQPSQAEIEAATAIAPFIYLRQVEPNVESMATSADIEYLHSIKQSRPKFEIPLLTTLPKTVCDLKMVLLDTAKTLKKFTKSKHALLYLIDDQNKEIYHFSTQVMEIFHTVNYKIEPGTTLAAYVAYTLQYIVTEDILGDLRFPKGLGWNGGCIGPALCIPLVSPVSLELFAVIELSKKVTSKCYSKLEVEACLNLCGWISATIQENHDAIQFQKEKAIYDYLKHLVAIYFCQTIELNIFFSELVISARIALCAQSSAFYTVARVDDRGELEMDMYIEVDEGKHTIKQWFRMSTSRTVAAKVASTGSFLNLNSRELKRNKFNTKIFKPLPCRNILSIPLSYNDRIVGVIDLINKNNSEKFTESDITVMNNIALFCSITLACFTLKEDMKRLVARLNVRQNLLENHMVPCEHDLKVFHEMTMRIPANFISCDFAIDESVNKMELCAYAQELFECILGLPYLIAVQVDKLLLMIVKATPDEIFHNIYHSFSTFHMVCYIISQYPHLFTIEDKEDLLLAAICHGVHKNKMLSSTVSLDVLPDYAEWKPFKYDETLGYIEVILKVCNVFPPSQAVLPQEARLVYRDKLNEIGEYVLQCYQKDYYPDGKDLVNRLDSKLFKWNHPEDRNRMKRAVMIVSSYYLHFKPFVLSVTELQKLYRQLEIEIEEIMQEKYIAPFLETLPIVPTKNRTLHKMANEQILFLNKYVLPWIYLMNVLFPKTAILYEKCQQVLLGWEGVLRISKGDEQIWFPDKSIVYKTKNIKDEVMNVLDSVASSNAIPLVPENIKITL